MPKMRLDKLLSHLNCGSRKEVQSFIRAGRVAVNGTDGALHIRDIIITAPIILQIVRLMITSFTFLYQGKYLCGIAKQHRHSSYNCYFYFTFTLTILLNLPVLTCLPTLL